MHTASGRKEKVPDEVICFDTAVVPDKESAASGNSSYHHPPPPPNLRAANERQSENTWMDFSKYMKCAGQLEDSIYRHIVCLQTQIATLRSTWIGSSSFRRALTPY